MSLDLWVGLGVLVGLFMVEGALPYDQTRDRRAVHGVRNLGLAIASGVVGAALAPLLLGAMSFGSAQGWGLCPRLDLGGLGGALISFVLFDLWMYGWHRANHRIPFLWRFHRVHHTDPAMDCTTALRFHPGEILLSGLANLPVIVALGMSLQTFVLYKAVMVAVILFHHSNLAVPARIDRGLRRLIVSPSMHRVHHSEIRAETDSNYGTIFSFWDRLFGSLRVREDTQAIRFGIGRFAGDAWQRPLRLLTIPFLAEWPPGPPTGTRAAPVPANRP
ncbi:sterol desaturase family protein [uncultured Lamprocystis sp.]|uniref:sterol desaturase family protein n=1 Tax=uncultured Lamprocystis sp. TaxID=543132 RepID=UPI0025E5B9B7|nr:sterol desaturase family protein [uncultured Lamprocystis sp.]